MFRAIFMGAIFVTLCLSSARAEDAGQLKEQCATADQSHCAAYVAGVVDTLRMLSYKTAGGFFCSPQGTPPEQYISVTIAYLAGHPDNLRYNAAGEVMLALMQAFPCERVGEHQLPLPPPTAQPVPPRGN
jgi:hypothetical protein